MIVATIATACVVLSFEYVVSGLCAPSSRLGWLYWQCQRWCLWWLGSKQKHRLLSSNDIMNFDNRNDRMNNGNCNNGRKSVGCSIGNIIVVVVVVESATLFCQKARDSKPVVDIVFECMYWMATSTENRKYGSRLERAWNAACLLRIWRTQAQPRRAFYSPLLQNDVARLWIYIFSLFINGITIRNKNRGSDSDSREVRNISGS